VGTAPQTTKAKRWSTALVVFPVANFGLFSLMFSPQAFGFSEWFVEYVLFPTWICTGLGFAVSLVMVVSPRVGSRTRRWGIAGVALAVAACLAMAVSFDVSLFGLTDQAKDGLMATWLGLGVVAFLCLIRALVLFTQETPGPGSC
jgi:hypothetical protein